MCLSVILKLGEGWSSHGIRSEGYKKLNGTKSLQLPLDKAQNLIGQPWVRKLTSVNVIRHQVSELKGKKGKGRLWVLQHC